MPFNPAITEKIRTTVDIVELINEYIPLKQAGRNFKANCPFHSEKTASFMVSREKQIFHCFGCGAGGDSVTFLMKHESLTFAEAIRILAKKAGVSIPETSGESSHHFSKLYEIMEMAARFYERYLFTQEGKIAWAYLSKRGLSMATIKKFRIGFSPSSWELLYKFLAGKGYDPKDLASVGLITRKGNGSYYDWFRERIIFPIMNGMGHVVGFGGRTIQKLEPKYLNSPETPIYRKGMVLYGLNFARNRIIKEKKVIVVEGYMDLISLFQSGFDFTVATLGTAMTPMQLKLIKRFLPELFFAYDADKGGEEATIRGIEEALKLDFNIKVLELPPGKDPEEYLRSSGGEGIAGLIKNAPDFFDFRIKMLENTYRLDDSMGKIKIVRAVLSMLRSITGALERVVYIRKLSDRYSIPEETLRIELKSFKEGYKAKDLSPLRQPKGFSQEREIARIILSGGELSGKARKYLTPEDFEDEELREIMRIVLKFDHKIELKTELLLNEITDERYRSSVTGLLLEEPPYLNPGTGFSPGELLDEFILMVYKKRHSRKVKSMLEEIKKEEKNGNLETIREKQREYEELIRASEGGLNWLN